MKKFCVNVLLLLLLPGCGGYIYAQANFYEEEVKIFTGGIAAGFNLAQVDGDMYFGYNKIGISTGCFVRIGFTPKLSAGLEMLYAQKGSRGEAVVESPYMGTYTAICYIGLNYVEVPVTLQYKLPFFNVEAGASYSRLVKTTEWIVVDPPVAVNEVANRFNNTGLDYVFGASRKLSRHLLANVRFQYSIIPIRPIARVPEGYGYGTKGQFNNLFCVRLLYEF